MCASGNNRDQSCFPTSLSYICKPFSDLRFLPSNPKLKKKRESEKPTDRSIDRGREKEIKSTMGHWIFSASIVAASAAVLSAALALWLATPSVANFLVAGAPQLYGSVTSWLTPPYLYLIVNGIIISIAATSRYQKTVAADAQLSPFSEQADFRVEDADLLVEVQDLRVQGDESLSEPAKEEFVLLSSSWSPKMEESKDPLEKSTGKGLLVNKPLVSARLGRRRSIKSIPEGKALGVARPRKNETLESTWRSLTEGRAVPLARHLKKSDTSGTHARATAGDPTTPPAIHEIQHFESFTARSSYAAAGSQPPSSGRGYSSPVAKLRRESSLGQDDLNRRVEAFIKKFNEEMRLQREESLQKYKDMINRGSH
ncbi:hypothetical protein KFK09_021008 [Dendrobium nobile]|uniref:DUF4408 domain-containing protein n=1 Tax=Dendrobium nobile TaxID=94219 RepID=A0A8T3AN83_DENNO|nr:hypothetical protein KFK09_021008 [Dendrobium nobile]